MQAKLQEQFSPANAEVILGRLPDRIRAALITHAAEIEYPIEAVIEMAIASFLDTEALGFVDCKPERGTIRLLSGDRSERVAIHLVSSLQRLTLL